MCILILLILNGGIENKDTVVNLGKDNIDSNIKSFYLQLKTECMQ